MFESIAFYIFSVLTIASFVVVVTTKNALYALSSLAAGMILISGFFFLLNADFLGVVQIVVYTGAVMALYAFGMMFFDTNETLRESHSNPRVVFALSGVIAIVLVAMLIAPIAGSHVTALYPMVEGVGNSEAVGMVLFTKYLIPFEVAAVMLLVAMIGGIVLASKKMDESLTTSEQGEVK